MDYEATKFKDGWYITRPGRPFFECLRRDGSWRLGYDPAHPPIVAATKATALSAAARVSG